MNPGPARRIGNGLAAILLYWVAVDADNGGERLTAHQIVSDFQAAAPKRRPGRQLMWRGYRNALGCGAATIRCCQAIR